MNGLVVPALIVSTSLLCAAAGAQDAPTPAPAGGVAFEPGTPAWADVLAKAKSQGKPAFVDFSTTWCGWCRRMEQDTFSQGEVADVMKGFVNVRLDAEEGEGPDLVRRYGVHGYPTMLVVDAAGDEVDRIVGYLPPREFTERAQRILRGEGTLPALRRQAAEHPDDLAAGAALASKLAASKVEEASSMFECLAAKAATKDRAVQAKIRLAYAEALLDAGRAEAALAQAEAVVRDYADTPAAADVVPSAGRAVLGADPARALAFLDAARPLAKDPGARFLVEELTIAVHRDRIAAALARQGEAAGDDPEQLNQAAWTCFEQKANLTEALRWASRAAELSKGAPEILDTLANLQWALDFRDDAIATEAQAAARAEGGMKKEFTETLTGWRAIRAAEGPPRTAPPPPDAPTPPK